MPEEVKEFDALSHINGRNAADAARIAGKEPPPLPGKPKEEGKVEEKPHISRSARREINRAREDAAEARGRAAVLQELLDKNKVEPAKEAPKEDDPEPKREQFVPGPAGDSEYNRAVGRWDGRQEAKKELAKRDEQSRGTQEMETLRSQLQEADTKAAKDRELLPDWEEKAAVADNADALKVDWDKHPELFALMMLSDLKAFVLYHFADHEDELQALLDLSKDVPAQIRAFHRLEGRLEKMYTPEDKKAAAQAGEEVAPKDRTHPAEATKDAGRNPSERDAHKPRPSTEVTARGGSPPPEKPAPGSREWMEQRNRMQFQR